MNKKIVIKSLLTLVLILGTVLQFNVINSNAATTTKVGWVSISSGTLTVKSGPGASYKTVGSLKNNASVSVYSQTKNGWTEIGYKSKRAYITTKSLRMYSYLMDKKKTYTYAYRSGEKEIVSYQGKNQGWDEWNSYIAGQGDATFYLKEDSKGLYFDSHEFYTELSYPLKVGKEWEDLYSKSKIIAMNGTLKTPAGTFNNVVTVKTSDGTTSYYAQNVGFIKSVYNGKTMSHLVSIVNK